MYAGVRTFATLHKNPCAWGRGYANFAMTEFSEFWRTTREVRVRDSRILRYVKLQSERV
jgi:hypothetical protein